MSTDLEQGLGDFVAGLDHAVLTEEVLVALKRAVLDCLAVIVGGSGEEVARKVVGLVTREAPDGPASVVGSRRRTSLAGAALANGTMGHALDYDDVSWTMFAHATAPVLPAVLAISEWKGHGGRDLLLAFLAGLEVEMKLGAAAAPVHYEAGWHSTGTLGTFGAAAGAAKALGLDATGVQTALGIAASRASGLRENFGTMTKPLHVGFAARDGLEAALLASLGVTSGGAAIAGSFGFLDVLAPGHGGVDGLLERLGNPFDMVEPGLAYKLYPSCGDTHAGVDAVLSLRGEHGLDPEHIVRVKCGITPLAATNLVHSDPKTPLAAKFSMEYCLAAALVRGRLGLQEFLPDAVVDPAIRSLLERVEVRAHPRLSSPDEVSICTPAIVEIETADGRVLEKGVWTMRGHPENPLSAMELGDKFRACAEGVLAPAAAERAIDLIDRLETVATLSDLVDALTPEAVAGE